MGYQLLDDKNIRSEFFKAYSVEEAGTWARKIGMLLGSDGAEELYRWLGGSPLMREWVGGRLEKGMGDEVFRIRNKSFEATLVALTDDMRRDKTGQLKIRIQELAARAAVHWEKILTDLILTAETALCYDGQAFFDTDHVSGDSGTQNNDLTLTQVPAADVVLKTAPTAEEMVDIILEIIQHMYGFKDDVGEPINQNAKAFQVMVPTTFMAATLKALSAQFLSNGITNPLLASNFKIEALVNPRLTWTDKFAMFRSDARMKPFILQEEYGIKTGHLGAGSDEEFKNKRHLWGIETSRNVGFGVWQGSALVTLSTAS